MSKLNRREFLKLANRFLIAAGGIVIIGPIVAYFYPPSLEEVPSEPVLVGDENELAVNESKIIRYGRYPALIINTDDGLRAYSAVCTHFACVVKFEPEINQIFCPCHDGYFDPYNGDVLSGPPPTALDPIPVNVVDNQIYIGGEG